jgi:hypothetical protein
VVILDTGLAFSGNRFYEECVRRFRLSVFPVFDGVATASAFGSTAFALDAARALSGA